MNPFGYGNCASTGFSSEFCYVNQPTSCSDALDSLDLPGEKFSSEPCKGRKSHFILTKLNVSSIEVLKISNIFRTKYFLNWASVIWWSVSVASIRRILSIWNRWQELDKRSWRDKQTILPRAMPNYIWLHRICLWPQWPEQRLWSLSCRTIYLWKWHRKHNMLQHSPR